MANENLPRDGSSAPIQVARYARFYDATPSTPNVSPVNITSSYLELITPEGGMELHVESADTIFRIATDSTGTNGYALEAIGAKEIIPTGAGESVFIYGESAGTLSFWYAMMQ